MKILKPPKPPPEFKTLTLTCQNCTAELETEASDFRRDSCSDPRDGGYDYAVVTCPCCSTIITVDKERFPKHIYDKFLPRYNNYMFEGKD